MEHLKTTLQDALSASEGNVAARRELTSILQNALKEIEDPGDLFWKMLLYPQEYAVVKAAIQFNFFQHIAAGSKTADALAKQTGAEKLLVVRLMRVLAALGIVRETAFETYENGPAGELLINAPAIRRGLSYMFDVAGQAAMKMPEVVCSTLKNPVDEPIIFQRAFGEGAEFFGHLRSHPDSLQDFNELMAGHRLNRFSWFDFFPVKENLLKGFEGGPLLVDMGGNQGSELESFKKRFPDASGLILQDLPVVIDGIKELSESITRMKHDFLTEQPVKGARAYYFRSVLHDWDDIKCREILRNLRPAMKSGYSKLLINDWIIPDKGAALYPSLLDINMMALFSSMERTESQWTALLEAEGFKILKFWSVPGTEGCIEAVLQD